MPKKTNAPSFSRANKSVNTAIRADDERLRDKLRNADMRKFDKAFAKAIPPSR